MAIVAAGFLLSACAPKAKSAPELLYPVGDESSLESSLRDYLQVKHQLVSELRVVEQDAVLLTSFASDQEHWNVTVDSEPSTRDGSQRVIMVYLDGDYGVEKKDVERMREVIEKHNRSFWAGTFYLDEEDDILGKWAINIPGVGVHPEQVADAMQRLSQSWLELLNLAKDEGIGRVRHSERNAQAAGFDLASSRETTRTGPPGFALKTSGEVQ